MKDLKLDFENKAIINQYVNEKDRVLQHIKVAVRSWQGDWFLNEDWGVDYDNSWGSELTMSTYIQRQIKQVSGVLSIDSFTISTDTSDENNIKYIINTNITLDSGIITISEVI